jgi:hypothetical protein
MVAITIPQTDEVQGFLDSITLPSDGESPSIPLIVKVYPGLRWWGIVAYTADGRTLLPWRNLCTTTNLWDAHASSLRDMFGRAIVCAVQGETDATKPLYGQCTVEITALASTAVLTDPATT